MDAIYFRVFWIGYFLPVMAKCEIIPLFGSDAGPTGLPPVERLSLCSFGVDMEVLERQVLKLSRRRARQQFDKMSLYERNQYLLSCEMYFLAEKLESLYAGEVQTFYEFPD